MLNNKKFMLNLTIEDMLCNLECKYCWISESTFKVKRIENIIKKGESVNYSIESLLKKIDRILLNEEATVLKLSGGEIFLIPEIFDIVKKYEEKFKLIQILTNGTLLNKKILDSFDNEKYCFQISLDGDSLFLNSYRFGKNKTLLSKLLNNIAYLYSKNYNIEINSVVTPINKLEVFQFINRFKNQYPKITILPFPARFTNEKYLIRNFSEKEKSKIFLNEHTNIPYIKEMIKLKNEGIKNYTCYLDLLIKTIDENGDIYYCPCGNISYLGNIFSKEKKVYDEKEIKSKKLEKCNNCFTNFDIINLFFNDLIDFKELKKTGIFKNREVAEEILKQKYTLLNI